MAKETLTIAKGGESFPSGIVIHDIIEAAPVTSFTGVDRASGIGQRVTAYRRQYMDVSVKFAFYGRLTQTQRAYRLNDVIGWALRDGPLSVGHRPGCELNVRLLTLPARTDQQRWEQDYMIVFRAHELPYWVSDSDDVIINRHDAPPETISAMVDGTAETPLCCRVQGDVSRITLTGNNQTMTFANLGMQTGSVFELGCDGRGVMYAKINGANCMSKLLTISNDCIMLRPGVTQLGLAITGGVSDCKLYTRARWA